MFLKKNRGQTQSFGVLGVPLFSLLFDWLPVCRWRWSWAVGAAAVWCCKKRSCCKREGKAGYGPGRRVRTGLFPRGARAKPKGRKHQVTKRDAPHRDDAVTQRQCHRPGGALLSGPGDTSRRLSGTLPVCTAGTQQLQLPFCRTIVHSSGKPRCVSVRHLYTCCLPKTVPCIKQVRHLLTGTVACLPLSTVQY